MRFAIQTCDRHFGVGAVATRGWVSMVKVVRFHEPGGPEVLRIEDLPPRAPGPGEARLRVEAIGLNRAEVLFRSGQYLEAATYPARIGYEAAGIVDAVGDGVSLRPGDVVSVVPAFSMNEYGVYGEQATVPARAVDASRRLAGRGGSVVDAVSDRLWRADRVGWPGGG